MVPCLHLIVSLTLAGLATFAAPYANAAVTSDPEPITDHQQIFDMMFAGLSIDIGTIVQQIGPPLAWTFSGIALFVVLWSMRNRRHADEALPGTIKT